MDWKELIIEATERAEKERSLIEVSEKEQSYTDEVEESIKLLVEDTFEFETEYAFNVGQFVINPTTVSVQRQKQQV